MKRKALRVRSEGSIPTYVTEAESRKQQSDSPLCNSLLKGAYLRMSPKPNPESNRATRLDATVSYKD